MGWDEWVERDGNPWVRRGGWWEGGLPSQR